MPSTKEMKLFERACLDLHGAGGEPLGEPPAPPSSVGQRSGSSAQLVERTLASAPPPGKRVALELDPRTTDAHTPRAGARTEVCSNAGGCHVAWLAVDSERLDPQRPERPTTERSRGTRGEPSPPSPREGPIPESGELSWLIEPEQPHHSDRLMFAIGDDRQHDRGARAGVCVLARDPLRGGVLAVDARNGRKRQMS